MSILSVGRITLSPCGSQRMCELTFDGRQIGIFHCLSSGVGHLELLTQANPEDVREAGILAMTNGNAASLQGYAETLFKLADAREQALRRMRHKLRKNTLFATPGSLRIRSVASPYCERVRSSIKSRYPEAVILNTLSEDEAFRHYSSPSSDQLVSA